MKYYIDFDGVILDTLTLYNKIFKEKNIEKWEHIYNHFEFDNIFSKENEINDSINKLKILQKNYNLTLLSKVVNDEEAEAKKRFLKNNSINIETIFVPYHHKKTDYVEVNDSSILIDDQIDNIDDWVKLGGIGILFSKEIIDGYTCVYDLDVIRKQEIIWKK